MNEFKDKLSDWSTKMVGGKKFDDLFHIDGTPLSWFYRPILYSSLLPAPFVTTKDFLEKKTKSTHKIQLFSYFFRQGFTFYDRIRKIKSGPLKISGKQKILFLTFTNYSFREKKIIEKIKKDAFYESFLLAVDPLSKFPSKKLQEMEHSLYQYYDSFIEEKAQKNSQKMSTLWDKLTPKFKNWMLGEDVFRYYQHNLDFLYSKEFIYITSKYYHTFLKIFQLQDVRGIVLGSQNNLIEKACIAAAKKLGLPVFIIQHGIALGELPTIDTPDNVKFAVFSERYKKQLQKLHVPEKNITITGPIILDGIEKHVGTKQKTGNILFATSPNVEDRYMDKKQYFSKVRKILLDLKKLEGQITIKLHPREIYLENYEAIIQELELPATISTSLDREQHYALIANSDLTISYGSTVALEAMIIGRPALTLEIFDGENPSNSIIRSSSDSVVVKYNQDISLTAKKLIQMEAKHTPQLVQDLCYKLDGKAYQRTIDFIYNEVNMIKLNKHH